MKPEEPVLRDGFPVWSRTSPGAEARFVGRGALLPRREILRHVGGPDRPVAWGRQIHSAKVLVARPGLSGTGDAVVTTSPELAVAVSVADCVPVLLLSARAVAAVHAGWRGLVAGVLAAAVDGLRAADAREDLAAWIGPAIGSCCYEVGDDVASRVVASSDPSVRKTGERGRAHLDLQAAAAHQLRSAGVTAVQTIACCTRCHPALLWSYRRSGKEAGRNLAFAWLR